MFKAVVPKLSFNKRKLERELTAGMNKYMLVVSADFNKTTRTWKEENRPAFKPKIVSKPNLLTGEVSTIRDVYRYVSAGTKRHFIAPKRARALRFRSGYKAKTSPGRIGAASGGSFGGFVSSKGHWVSGIRARKFDKQIKKNTEKLFKKHMTAALYKGLVEVS